MARELIQGLSSWTPPGREQEWRERWSVPERKLEVERQRKVHEAEHGVDLKHVGATAKKSKGKSLGGYHEV